MTRRILMTTKPAPSGLFYGVSMTDTNESGSKYLRSVPCSVLGQVDVYAVLDAFDVACPARQHAIKKLLCTGIRGKGDVMQDLREARDAITRAIQMQEAMEVCDGRV